MDTEFIRRAKCSYLSQRPYSQKIISRPVHCYQALTVCEKRWTVLPVVTLTIFLAASCLGIGPVIARAPSAGGVATELRYEDHTYSETIHTVQFFKNGFELAPPITDLATQEPLILRFDDLQPYTENLSYTVVHCSASWKPTDLMAGQYLTGAFNDYIPAGRQSYNTLQPFIEYELEVPNQQMQITRSGNYLLKVYRNSDPEDLVLTRRFMVMEQALQIDAMVVTPRGVDQRDVGQQVDLTIRYPGLNIQDPFSDVHVTMLQNMRWDDARTDFRPKFVRDRELVYDHPPQGMFLAGNEYRNFDLKNIRYAGRNVARIDPGPGQGVYEAYILPEVKRNIRVYTNQQDINGKFLPKNDLVDGDPLGTDYVNVHFKLPMEQPLGQDIYVYGGLFDNQCSVANKMTYSSEEGGYMLTTLLKQGFYDFTYATIAKGTTAPDLTVVEGSHYQTENDYLVLVYLTDYQQRYDRLVGAKFLNSVRR